MWVYHFISGNNDFKINGELKIISDSQCKIIFHTTAI